MTEQEFQDSYCSLYGLPLKKQNAKGIDYFHENLALEFTTQKKFEGKDVTHYIRTAKNKNYRLVFDSAPDEETQNVLRKIPCSFEAFDPKLNRTLLKWDAPRTEPFYTSRSWRQCQWENDLGCSQLEDQVYRLFERWEKEPSSISKYRLLISGCREGSLADHEIDPHDLLALFKTGEPEATELHQCGVSYTLWSDGEFGILIEFCRCCEEDRLVKLNEEIWDTWDVNPGWSSYRSFVLASKSQEVIYKSGLTPERDDGSCDSEKTEDEFVLMMTKDFGNWQACCAEKMWEKQ